MAAPVRRIGGGDFGDDRESDYQFLAMAWSALKSNRKVARVESDGDIDSPIPREPKKYKGKTLKEWLNDFKVSDDAEVRLGARKVLGPGGPFQPVPALIEFFNDPELPARSEVAETLADYGSTVVPALLAALKRPQSRIRAGAAEALGYVDPNPANALPALISCLKDPVSEVRAAAAWSIGNLGGSHGSNVASLPIEKADFYLAKALADKNDKVREAAAFALGGVDHPSKLAIKALISALKDKDNRVQSYAVDALGHFGPEAAEAVPALVKLLRTYKYSLYFVATALGSIGPAAKDAVPALADCLTRDDEKLRHEAATALGKIGPDARMALPGLKAALKRETRGTEAEKNGSAYHKAIERIEARQPDGRALQ